MGSRMDKYKDQDTIPTRSDKNKELYKQIYNAYDEFENLIVPSNAREINPSDLKKEIASRQEYKKQKEEEYLVEDKNIDEDVEDENDEVYDINELLSKATQTKKEPELVETSFANGDYLKKLKLDNRRTNIEQVKEMYEDIQEEASIEDESLMRTANLSLEILSDLKGDSDKTVVSAPIKDEELPEDAKVNDFYSNTYKFSKKDFEDKDYERADDDEEDDDDDESEKAGNGKFLFRILILIFGILLLVLILLYFINYFNRV